MNRKIYIIIILVVLTASVLFCSLWICEKNKKDSLVSLCRTNAEACLEALKNYEKTGNETYYMFAVSEFYAFEEAYRELETANGNYSVCNTVYGAMIFSPEKIKANISSLIEAMEILSEDYNHANGHNKLMHIRNAVCE